MRRKICHIFNIGMSVPLKRIQLKTENVLNVRYFLLEVTFFKLPQHPRSVLPWHLNVCKSSVYMIQLMMFLITD